MQSARARRPTSKRTPSGTSECPELPAARMIPPAMAHWLARPSGRNPRARPRPAGADAQPPTVDGVAIDPDAELVVALADDTNNMDPRIGMGSIRSNYIRQVFESLVDVDRAGQAGAGPGAVLEAGQRPHLGVHAAPRGHLPRRRAVQRRHRALQPRPLLPPQSRPVGHQGRGGRHLVREGLPVRDPLGEGGRLHRAHPHERAGRQPVGLHRPRAAGAARVDDQERRGGAERTPGRHRTLEARRSGSARTT